MIIPGCDSITDKQGRELIVHGTAAFPIACYHDNFAVNDCGWHWHDELELFIVSEGTATASAGTDKFILQTGQGLFINTAILHEVHQFGKETCRLHSIVFHPRLVGGSLDSIYWQNYLQPIMSDISLHGILLTPAADWQADILNLTEAAWHACETEESGYEFFVREQLSRIVFSLAKNRPAEKKRPDEKALRDDTRIKQMLQYIHDHFGEPMDTAQIAESAMISESEALRCFHTMINTTPIQYVKQYRLGRAAELLTSTTEKIVTIGLHCGFQEMSYFARSFRQAYGCTPSEYRKNRREKHT